MDLFLWITYIFKTDISV